jgi:hypothetical protein
MRPFFVLKIYEKPLVCQENKAAGPAYRSRNRGREAAAPKIPELPARLSTGNGKFAPLLLTLRALTDAGIAVSSGPETLFRKYP